MVDPVRFSRLNALPVSPGPDTLYFVKTGSDVQLYVTGDDAVPRKVVDSALTDLSARFDALPIRYIDEFWTASDGADYAPAARLAIEYCHTNGFSVGLRGVRRFNSTVIDPYGLHWIGEPGCIILNGSPDTPAMQLGTTGARTYGGSITGTIGFASAPGIVGVAGQFGLRVFNCGQVNLGTIKTVGYAPYAPLYDGIKLEDVYQASQLQSETQDCLHDGITFHKVGDLDWFNSRSDGNGNDGIVSTATEGVSFIGVSAYANGRHSWNWAKHADGINKSNFLYGCVGDTSGDDSWLINDLWETELVSCWAASNISTSTNVDAAGFRIRGQNAKGLKFIGGRAINCNGDGVSIESDGTSPGLISFDGFDFGSVTAAFSGNGKGGTGAGLRLGVGIAAGAVAVRNSRFADNASGDVVNEGIAGALVYGSPTVTEGPTSLGELVGFSSFDGASIKGLGVSVGTSGPAVPVMSADNAWDGAQTFLGGINVPYGNGSAIINGDMEIDQQREGAAALRGSIDRWALEDSSASAPITVQRVAVNRKYRCALRLTSSASPITTAASKQISVRHPIEGCMLHGYGWGTTAGVDVELEFTVTSSVAGQFCVALQNGVNSMSYVIPVTIDQANVEQTFTRRVAAPPSGSPWAQFIPNQLGAYLRFDMGAGTNYVTTISEEWLSGDKRWVSPSQQLAYLASATVDISGVHLRPADGPMAYVPRPYMQELALCQRYYYKTFPIGVAPAGNAGLASALTDFNRIANGKVGVHLRPPVPMYNGGTLTVTAYNPLNASQDWRNITAGTNIAATINGPGTKGGQGVFIEANGTVATIGDYFAVHAVIDAGFN